MSLAGTLMTPRIDSRIRHKLLMGKCKGLDFKDILRERFSHRIKQNRRALFEKMRRCESAEIVQDTLSDYLSNEMNEFRNYVRENTPERSTAAQCNEDNYDRELNELDKLHDEFLREQLSWIIEEYRREEDEIQVLMAESLPCPICKRGTLQKYSEQTPVTCSICTLLLPSAVSIEILGSTLRENIEEHSARCSSDPQFMLVNELDSNSLLMICSSCSLLNALI